MPGSSSRVQLDLRLVEADQVATPLASAAAPGNVLDGIALDEFGNPVAYYVLRVYRGPQCELTAFSSPESLERVRSTRHSGDGELVIPCLVRFSTL
jgi:capsid protein